MQKELQEVLRNRLTSVQRMEAVNDRLDGQEVVSMVFRADMETLRQTDAALDRESFGRAVQRILTARSVYLIGVRSSAALASFGGAYGGQRDV